MKRAPHSGDHAVNCPACLTRAERNRMPWHRDAIHTISLHPGYQTEHDAAIKRAARKAAA